MQQNAFYYIYQKTNKTLFLLELLVDYILIVDNIGYEVSISEAKIYIPSTINIDLILWHTQSNVYAVK